MHIELPFVDCTDLIGDRSRLLEHSHQNGYLFFPRTTPCRTRCLNYVNRCSVWQINMNSLNQAPISMPLSVEKGSSSVSRIDPRLSGVSTLTFRNSDFFTPFPITRHIVQILETLFGNSVLIHPRHICHVIFPGEHQYTTPPHQDFHPVRGAQDTWTVWTPLGDCDAELGGLAIARGSNRRGFLQDNDVRSWKLIEESTEWAWNPFKCGDVLMFHSLTIHRGRDNMTEDRIRLATSARYQSVSEPVDEDALTVHLGCAKWEEVYSDWKTERLTLKYYWNAIDMDVQPAYHRRRTKSASFKSLGEKNAKRKSRIICS